MLLVAGANSSIVRAEAPPLIKALLQAYPEAASMRIQPELGLAEGQLPLHLAILNGWDADTVKEIIAAFPDAAMIIDVIDKNKGKKANVKKDSYVSARRCVSLQSVDVGEGRGDFWPPRGSVQCSVLRICFPLACCYLALSAYL